MNRNARTPRSLTLLAALLLCACSPVFPTPQPTAALPSSTLTRLATPSPSPTPGIAVDPALLRGLTIQVWQAFSGGAADVFAAQVAEFNLGNEWGLTVNPSGYGDYTTLFEAVNTAMVDAASTTLPDLVASLPEQTLQWNTSGLIVDLSPYLGDPTWGLAGSGIVDIPPVFWDQDVLDGKQLGVPAQRSARFLYYNQTWAHELGFTDPPSTPDQFRQQACAANASFRSDQVLRNDGYGGWIVDTDWQTVYSWMLAFGGGVVEDGSYAFRTDPNLAALQFIKGLFDDHCAWLSKDETPFDSFANRSALFVSGDLAAVPLAQDSMTRLENSDEWTLLPFPGKEAGVLVSYGPSFSVLSSTPEKQLASWLFVRWLLTADPQSRWVQATGLFPLYPSVSNLVVSGLIPSAQWRAAVEQIPIALGVPQLASWRKVRYVLEDGTRVIFQTDVPLDQLPDVLTGMDSTATGIDSP